MPGARLFSSTSASVPAENPRGGEEARPQRSMVQVFRNMTLCQYLRGSLKHFASCLEWLMSLDLAAESVSAKASSGLSAKEGDKWLQESRENRGKQILRARV